MSRYDLLTNLIDEIRPRVIIEVGVARCVRAIAMIERACLWRDKVHYIGYDVFHSVGEYNDAKDFHQAARNHKRVESLSWCERKLDNVRVGRHEHKPHPGLTWELVEGDTRQTLHGTNMGADLAFIDGDHRIDAIFGDYSALRKSRVVVLDDYFEPDERGCPDITQFGCNRLYDLLNRQGPQADLTLGSVADPCDDCGTSRLVVVRRKPGAV